MSSSLFLVIMICLFGKIHADDANVDITKISIETDNIVVYFTAVQSIAPKDTIFYLIVGDVDGDESHQKKYDMTGTYNPSDTEINLSFGVTGETFTERNTLFILFGELTSNNIGEAEVHVNIPNIPGTEIKAQKLGSVLRINDDAFAAWKICAKDSDNNFDLNCKSGGQCYGINTGVVDSVVDFSACQLADTNEPVLVKSFKADLVNNAGPTAKTITLDYASSPTITTVLNKAPVAPMANPTKEAIVYTVTEDGNTVYFCTSATSCTLTDQSNTDYIPGDKKLNILFMTVEDGSATGYTAQPPFQDSNLEVFNLGETVLESRWVNYADKYTAVKSKVEDDNSFHTVHADCTDDLVCYAYFVNIAAEGNYTVTTKPGDTPIELNAIKSVSVHMTPPALPLNNVQEDITIEKQYKKHSGNLELNICYSPDSPTKSLNNTQLEVVLISANRQWRKVLEETMRQVEQDSCYSTTFLLKSGKDSHYLLTALVIQRDVGSNEVLTFHRSDLNLSDNNDSSQTTRSVVIIGTSVLGLASLMALVIIAIIIINRRHVNDGLQYPLQRTTFENSDIVLGIDNLNAEL